MADATISSLLADYDANLETLTDTAVSSLVNCHIPLLGHLCGDLPDKVVWKMMYLSYHQLRVQDRCTMLSVVTDYIIHSPVILEDVVTSKSGTSSSDIISVLAQLWQNILPLGKKGLDVQSFHNLTVTLARCVSQLRAYHLHDPFKGVLKQAVRPKEQPRAVLGAMYFPTRIEPNFPRIAEIPYNKMRRFRSQANPAPVAATMHTSPTPTQKKTRTHEQSALSVLQKVRLLKAVRPQQPQSMIVRQEPSVNRQVGTSPSNGMSSASPAVRRNTHTSSLKGLPKPSQRNPGTDKANAHTSSRKALPSPSQRNIHTLSRKVLPSPSQRNIHTSARKILPSPAQRNIHTSARKILPSPAQRNIHTSARKILPSPAQRNIHTSARKILPSPAQRNIHTSARKILPSPAQRNIHASARKILPSPAQRNTDTSVLKLPPAPQNRPSLSRPNPSILAQQHSSYNSTTAPQKPPTTAPVSYQNPSEQTPSSSTPFPMYTSTLARQNPPSTATKPTSSPYRQGLMGNGFPSSLHSVPSPVRQNPSLAPATTWYNLQRRRPSTPTREQPTPSTQTGLPPHAPPQPIPSVCVDSSATQTGNLVASPQCAKRLTSNQRMLIHAELKRLHLVSSSPSMPLHTVMVSPTPNKRSKISVAASEASVLHPTKKRLIKARQSVHRPTQDCPLHPADRTVTKELFFN